MKQVSENEFFAYINEYDHYYEFNDELKVENAPYNEYVDIKDNRTDRLLGRIIMFLLNHKLKYVYEIQEVRTMTEIIINKERHECPPAVAAYIKELKKENARLEEGYQKPVGVIAATDCAECKDKAVKHGQWIKTPPPYHVICSSCKTMICIKFYGVKVEKFCRNCGAKMDLKDGETK
jgi:hypothetical protein